MFEVTNKTEEDIDLEKVNKYLKYLVKKLELESAIFNIIFITDKEIHNINKEYRHIDRPTDVISFALEDYSDVNYPDFRLLGDIYISVDTAKVQAIEFEHSTLKEIFFLMTHGVLHLLGYDHMKEEDEKIMFPLQEKLMDEYEKE